jgi:very-short-patch-repair endonuclease
VLRLRTQGEVDQWAGQTESKRNLAEDLLESQFRLYRLPVFEREYKFAAALKRQYRFDFAFIQYAVAVEIEGLVPERVTILRKDGTKENRLIVGGRHASIEGMIKDMEKYNLAAKLGWFVLRVPQKWVTENKAIAVVIETLSYKGCKPHEATR